MNNSRKIICVYDSNLQNDIAVDMFEKHLLVNPNVNANDVPVFCDVVYQRI